MSTAISITKAAVDGLERVLIEGDLGGLTQEQRINYYKRVCESVGLNPLTQPFEYLKLQGKTILYARRACTDQLRNIHKVSVTITGRERVDGIYVVSARAETPDGRTDESVGAVPIDGLKGEALANALMKAETKAKRRVTLAICGLSMLDELEVESVQRADATAKPDQPYQVKVAAVPALPAPQDQPPATPTTQQSSMTPAMEIKALVEVDLDGCGTRDALVAWAQALHGVQAPGKAKVDAWKAFQAKCILVGLDARELVDEAKAP